MTDTLKFLMMQRELQIAMRQANPTQGGDPYEMSPDQLAQFITWNHTALIVELGEMLNEVGWKPWASSRHVNYPAALHEMVDAWHFFLNILLGLGALAGDAGGEQGHLAAEFDAYYQHKNAKNLQRQLEGYDGVSSKCPNCKRDLNEQTLFFKVMTEFGVMCSSQCAEAYETKEGENMSKEDDELREKIMAKSAQMTGSGTPEELEEAVKQKHREMQANTLWDPAPNTSSSGAFDVVPGTQPELVSIPLHVNPRGLKIMEECEATDEPAFVFRAKDFFAIQVLSHYANLVEQYGPDDASFHADIVDAIGEFKEWQKANVSKVKYPD